MAEGDFSVYVKIQADTSNFERGMKKAQTSATNLSNTFGNLSKIITKALSLTGIAVGTKAIVDFGKSCVQSVTQATKQFNILDNTIKATGADAWTSTKEMESMAKSLSDSTNYSVTEIEKMQSVLLGFRDITGDTFQEASDAILDMATVMGMDLTSAVQTVGKALDDPIKGLDSLRRQGFAFTDEQKIELKQLVATGKKMEAQKIILDELATTYGGASKAGQDSFAKQTHAVENFSDTLGAKLIPVMKVFAEDNANMINSLREVIENTDFTPVVNVITNLKKVFAETFDIIGGYLMQGADWVKDFIDRFNFAPVISLLDTLVGSVANVVKIIKDVSSQNFGFVDQIKETIISISNSEIFTKIVEFVNKIIDAFFFLWGEINDIISQIRQNIFNKIIDIWGKVKEFFENTQNALVNSAQDISSWGEFFWKILDNVYRIFQDLINGVKAILNKDWKVAWEYAKLAVMRVDDSILTMVSTIANAFPDLINGIIKELNKLLGVVNSVREFFGQDPLGLIEAFESVDLSKKSGLEDKIKETEARITELTGYAADTSIKELEGVSTAFAGFTFSALGYIQDLTEGTEQEGEKQKKTYKGTAQTGIDSFKKVSEWDQKLLQQRLKKLKDFGKDYTDEYHQIQTDLINSERDKALESADTEEERAKINKYYDNLIAEENERAEKAKQAHAKETVAKIVGLLKTMASKAVEVFKKVASTIKNAFSAIGNFVKNTFSGIKNIFEKLFDFKIDDALDNLLKVEDAILTFFVETLPNLPSFFESAFGSIVTLMETLINSIDWGKVKEFMSSIINTFITNAPGIIKGITNIFTNIVSSVSDIFVDNAPGIVDAFGSMFFSIIEALPEIITKVISALGSAISEIGKYITENGQRLSDDLSNIVKSLINGIADFIKNGGWKNLLNAILTIQKAIENAVAENLPALVDTIIDALPDLIEFLKNSIISASKTLGKIIKPIIKLVMAIIEALINVLLSDEVIDASLDAIMALVDAVFEELVPAIIRLIPKLLVKIISAVIKNFPKLVKSLIDGFISAFKNLNWLEVVKQIFMGFIDAFKDLFGIHSPSTLFEGFGFNIIEGLLNGLDGIVDSVKGIFENLFNVISDIFGVLTNNITDIFNNLTTNLTSTLNNIADNVTSIFNNITSNVTSSLNNLSNNATSIFNNISDNATSIFNNITSNITSAFNNVSSNFTSIFNNLSNLLGNLLSQSMELLNKLLDVNIPGLGGGTSSGGSGGTSSGGGLLGGGLIPTGLGGGGGLPIGVGGIDVVGGLPGVGSGESGVPIIGEIIDYVEGVGNDISDMIDQAQSGNGYGKHSTGSTAGDVAIDLLTGGLRHFFANGTNNALSGLALVGEAGPELVRFNGGEQVLNTRNTQKALEGVGGNTNNFNVTFNNLQDTSAFAMMNQWKQYNRQMAINGIL